MAKENRSFFGFLAVGFISLLGGIIMFIKVVPPREADGMPPRDMSMIFIQVFSQQANLKSGSLPFNPDISTMGVDTETCARYQCVFRLVDGGRDYDFRLTKNDRTWMINSSSPMAKEIKVEP